MIKSVTINNFKSVVDLSIELGAINVIIGENGCGKSNILEAIAFGAAASSDKLDFEFLGNRGIRVPNPELIFSSFKKNKNKKEIAISFSTDDKLFSKFNYVLKNEKNDPNKWINKLKDIDGKGTKDKLSKYLFSNNLSERKKFSSELKVDQSVLDRLKKFANEFDIFADINDIGDKKIDFFKYLFDKFLNDRYSNEIISNFIIYSPEESSLRKFEDTSRIYPLGINGEGLFQYIRELILKKGNKRRIKEIKTNLSFIDWFEDFELDENNFVNENSLKIQDKYIDSNIKYFDQRSTNEGFLYLLFYITLIVSDKTPDFFAIDNIDASLNPKLCSELIKILVKLAKKHNKQVILTTQNPSILDGLDLQDKDQKLIVARRNEYGFTMTNEIKYNEKRKLKLSEIWLKGFIGGLPDNF